MSVGISMVLLFSLTIVLKAPITSAWLAVPIVILLLQFFGFGLGLMLGSLNVFFRDIGQGLGILLQIRRKPIIMFFNQTRRIIMNSIRIISFTLCLGLACLLLTGTAVGQATAADDVSYARETGAAAVVYTLPGGNLITHTMVVLRVGGGPGNFFLRVSFGWGQCV